MNRYEILMLATPQITQDEASNLEKGITSIVKAGKGEVLSFEKWGKCRLAYPVKNHDYGIYYLTRFEINKDPKIFKEIKTAFAVRYNDSIMRYVIVKLEADQTLEYKRPHTVEDIPTRDVDSFLRENKMEGLIKSGDKPADKKEASAEPIEKISEDIEKKEDTKADEGQA